MRVPKILAVIISILLGVGILVACAGNQTPVPTRQNPTSTPPAEEVKVATTASVTPVPAATVAPTSTTNAALPDPVLILLADEITTLEPYRMVSTHPDGSIASHLWDTLTHLNDQLQVEPGLAESWRLVNNFTWEFTLHQGINFHNGEALNADAVRFSIERARSMPDSLETFTRDVNLEKVEMVDDYTLRLTTRDPVANLPYHLTFLEILPPVYYSKTSTDKLLVAPVGSGPYELSGTWHSGQPLTLEAVPDYWGGAPALPRLVFKTVPQVEERLTALRSGQATLITDLPPIPKEQWNISGSELEAIESTQRMFIGIRAAEGSPLADKRVRQALNYGVNVKQFIDTYLAGYGQRYGSWVNPPENNQELSPWAYDPDMARDLLAQAGYREGFTTTLHAPIGVYNQDAAIAEAIGQQLSEIGVTVEIETADWSTYTHQLLSDKTPGLFLLGLASHGDGLEDTQNLSVDFAFNPTGWSNISFEEMLKRAASTFNQDSRIRLLNEAQSIAYDEAPWIWLWRSYDFYGVSQALDWTPRRDGLVNLYQSSHLSP